LAATIRLRAKARRLLDYTDSDIIDRYKSHLLESPDRHIWVGKVLVDVDEVIRRRFACDTRLCLEHASGAAKSKHSCCYDLDVTLLPNEVEAIERRLAKVLAGHPAVRGHVEESGFWQHDADWWRILQKKRDGTCVFLDHSEKLGFHCSLHATALRERIPVSSIKPLICRMFPLVVLEADGDHIITCYGEKTHRVLHSDNYETMNCLHPNCYAGTPVYIQMRSTLETLIGPEGYRVLAAKAEKILAKDEGNGHDAGPL
jgi:Fe-S-cluster containining protein